MTLKTQVPGKTQIPCDSVAQHCETKPHPVRRAADSMLRVDRAQAWLKGQLQGGKAFMPTLATACARFRLTAEEALSVAEECSVDTVDAMTMAQAC